METITNAQFFRKHIIFPINKTEEFPDPEGVDAGKKILMRPLSNTVQSAELPGDLLKPGQQIR